MAQAAPNVIVGKPLAAFDRIFAQLTQQAGKLAEAHAPSRNQDPVHWRKAGLLWPLFTKG